MDTARRQPYPSDLTDAEWAIIEPLLPPPVPAGAPRKVDLRECDQCHLLRPDHGLCLEGFTP